MVSVKNLIVKAGNHSASRRGFLRLSRVLPTSRMFTSGYVNTETILHFFNMNQPHPLCGQKQCCPLF